MNVLVSVIIPVYNGEVYLRQCLDSIVNQTLKEIEIICVNDGSSDGSLKILEHFQHNDKRFKIISQNASNAGHARNVGLMAATGKFISFLDCDDWFELEMLEKMYAQAIKTEADVIICKAQTFDQKTKTSSLKSFSLQENLVPAKSCFTSNDVSDDVFQLCRTAVWDKLYRKKFIDENRLKFQEQPRINDCFFSVMANIRATKISICNQFFVHYRINTGTSITSNFKQTYSCTLLTIKKIHETLTFSEQELFGVSFKNFSLRIIFYEFLRFPKDITFKYYKLLHSMNLKLDSLKSSEIYNPNRYELLKPILLDSSMSENDFAIAFDAFQKKYYRQRRSKLFLCIRKVRSFLSIVRTCRTYCLRNRFENFILKHGHSK
jgi:glycosyltransferase involved in cell wall biosynthesis